MTTTQRVEKLGQAKAPTSSWRTRRPLLTELWHCSARERGRRRSACGFFKSFENAGRSPKSPSPTGWG